MFEEFSSGYYLGRLYVEPYGGDRAVMHRDQHERVNEQLYAEGDGVERLDLPLVMKIGGAHFPVHGADGVPEGTVALPDEVADRTGLRNPPALSEVFLAKADRARQLLDIEAELPGAGV
ncbi:hypothetical protein BRC93_13165 [Halobacteriales archaeon QS_5_70_15]|nr:MAG: hypothetical protein BRC93_13165 [Halobacteriales archaeon QS_5_70_15]